MRLKILGFAFMCPLLFITSISKFNHAGAAATIQEDPQMAKQRELQRISMKELTVISTGLADHITDLGIAPKQDGTYDKNTGFYKAIAPFYVRNLPVYDGWGNNYRVYCGEACNGKYGISGCGSDDFLIVSYGRDRMKEDWIFEPSNPAAGLYELNNLDDFDKDLIIWNGSWIRAPKLSVMPLPAERPERDQAAFNLIRAIQNPEKRVAGLRRFLRYFPESSLKEQASLLLAKSLQDPSEKTAALRKFLADFPTSGIKDEAEYQLMAMISDPNERLAAQEKFVKDYPKSSYAGIVYLALLDARLGAKPLDEAKTNEIIDGYIGSTPEPTGPAGQFGLIAQANVLNTIADRLMVNEVLLDKALDLIQKAVILSEKIPAQFPGVSQFKAVCQTTLGQVYFKRKDYDQAEKELKKAIEMAGKEGVAEAHLFLGKIYEAKNNDDAALDAYLNAAALGSSGEIKSSLERAYRKKYGNLDGLEENLDAIYLARPKPFDPGHYAATGKESGRVVLAELFTGSECPPCVAADQAFDGVAERYDRNTVAVLVYHLHIPGPDPMTNPDTESHAKYYEVGSTPTVVIDGIDKQAGGGSSAQSPMVFNNYKGKIEARLSKPPLAVFTDLKAKIEGQTLTVTGQVNLVPEVAGRAEKVKLRIALVQDVVRYTGGNGVRFHNFVVRKFIGPPVGWQLEQPGTKTSFSESLNIATLGDNQREYLTKYENEIAGKFRPGFKFHEKLDRIEPGRLLIIAFVQDDQTKEILQAYFVKPGS